MPIEFPAHNLCSFPHTTQLQPLSGKLLQLLKWFEIASLWEAWNSLLRSILRFFTTAFELFNVGVVSWFGILWSSPVIADEAKPFRSPILPWWYRKGTASFYAQEKKSDFQLFKIWHELYHCFRIQSLRYALKPFRSTFACTLPRLLIKVSGTMPHGQSGFLTRQHSKYAYNDMGVSAPPWSPRTIKLFGLSEAMYLVSGLRFFPETNYPLWWTVR